MFACENILHHDFPDREYKMLQQEGLIFFDQVEEDGHLRNL